MKAVRIKARRIHALGYGLYDTNIVGDCVSAISEHKAMNRSFGHVRRNHSIKVERLVWMIVSCTLCIVILRRFVSVALVKWT